MKDYLLELNKLNKICVAVSGGVDSVCLLHYLKDNLSVDKLCAVNIEHGIRGVDSVNDSNFVKTLCREYNIELYQYQVDAIGYAKEKGMSIEQSARELRHDVFNDIINKGSAEVVATAHHSEDNAESILLHIIRGSGLSGLCGMSYRDNNLVRPFINWSKEDILIYCREHSVNFVEDKTNADNKYTRNFIRNKILPLLKEKNQKSTENINRLACIVKDAQEYMFSTLPKLEIKEGRVFVPKLHHYATSILIIEACKYFGVYTDIENKNIKMLVNGVQKTTTLPHNLVAYNEDCIVIRTKESECLNIKFDKNKLPTSSYWRLSLSDKKNNTQALYFDIDKIPYNAVWRNWQAGDYIVKFGGGKRSVADYFNDKKIPASLKDRLPLLCVDNKVLMIASVEISEDIRVEKGMSGCYIEYTPIVN